MPAAMPVRVAASMIVFTSLLSDMLIYNEKIIFSIHDFLHIVEVFLHNLQAVKAFP